MPRIPLEPVYRRIPWPGDSSDLDGLTAQAKAHLDDLRVKNFSRVTINGRSYPLRFFLTWCYDREITRPTEVTPPIIDRYQRFVADHKMKNGFSLTPITQRNYLVTISQYFQWLMKRGRIPFNPAAHIEMPKVPRHLPRYVLSIPQVDHLVGQANVSEPLGLRDRAIMETLYSTGMRRKELSGLHISDVNDDQRTLFIRDGKGGHQRVVPIGERALLWMHKYLDEVRPLCAMGHSEDWLFLTNAGEQVALDTLTKMIRDYVDQAGFADEKAGACHLFRHSCATHMLEGGADLRVIQELLGHVCLETTSIYTRITVTRLREVHAATHPARLEREPRSDEAGI